MSRAASHQGEDWPYHEDNHGNMVPCLHNPCRLHGGSEIFASSLDEAYEHQYENNDMVVNAVVSRDAQAIARLRGDIRKAVSDGGYLSVSSIDSEGNMIGGSLPVIDMNVPDDDDMPVTFEVDPSFSTKCCGRALNADVNAARNIRGRSSDVLPRGRGAVHRKTLYDVLENHHRVSCGVWLARHTTAGL